MALPASAQREGDVNVELRIGVVQSPRELEVDLAEDTDRDSMVAELQALLARGDGVLSVTDRRGRRLMVAVPKVAWVELGTASAERRVGFGNL